MHLNKNFIALAGLLFTFLTIWFTNPVGDFPLNDDWQYAYPVKSLIEKGQMDFMGVFAPNILLQIVWGFLFCKIAGGFGFTCLRFSTLTLAFAALFVFHILMKRNYPDKQISIWFATMALALNPLFYVLSFSFMSDIPFLAFCLGSIYSFYQYLISRKNSWFTAAIFLAIASYYIRQPGILLLPAFAVYILFRNNFSKSSVFISGLLTGLSFIAYISLELWIKPALSIDDNYVPVGEKYYEAFFHQPLVTALEWGKKFLKTYIYLGLFGLPFLPFLWRRLRDLQILTFKTWFLSVALNVVLVILLMKAGKVFPFGGNVLYNFGLGPELLADVYTRGLPNTPRLPLWVMLSFNFAGGLSASFLALLIFRGFSSLAARQKHFILFLLIINGMYLPVMSVTSFFDRYLLLPISSFFFVLTAFLEDKFFKFSTVRWLPFLIFGLFSILATKDYMSWNRAKNQAFGYLLAQQVPLQKMDAGYEFNGFYNYHRERTEVPGRSFWWVNDDHWMITFGEVPGYKTVKVFPFRRWLFFRKDAIHVLEKNE